MKFDVDPKIFSFFPGMYLVVAVPETLTNSDSEGLVPAYWNQTWLAAGNLDLPNAQSHPHVWQFREQFWNIPEQQCFHMLVSGACGAFRNPHASKSQFGNILK